MIEERDIQKIGEEVGKVIEQNIIPVLDKMQKDIDNIKTDITEVKSDLGKVKAEMVTKSYLDDKLADLEGNLISKLRKEDNKVNRLIEILKNKSILTNEEGEQFKEFQIFHQY